MLAYMTQHEIKPVVDSVFDFQDAIKAFQELAKGHQIGKIVIRH